MYDNDDDNRQWFSTAKKGMDIDEDYCRFCLSNFKQWNQVINNVCQSCGRVTQRVRTDKQEHISLTAINSNDPDNQPQHKGVALDIDYNPITVDDSTLGINVHDIRLQANSFKEAIKLIHETDKSPRQILNSKRDLFKVKTTVTDKFAKKAFLDEKT